MKDEPEGIIRFFSLQPYKKNLPETFVPGRFWIHSTRSSIAD
jgi:hypothetical protein